MTTKEVGGSIEGILYKWSIEFTIYLSNLIYTYFILVIRMLYV